MILATLGTQKFQFKRFVEAVDKLADEKNLEIFIQTGYTEAEVSHCEHQPFVDKEVFSDMIKECEVLITHSGVGSIMTGIRAEKPIIVVPRLKKYNEHVDDNQEEIAEAFSSKNYVLYCRNLKDLPEMIEEARVHKFDRYVECEGKIEDIILDFLETHF